MKLIAQMIARNEADRYLRPVLERLSRQVDELVFTDDASDDDTLSVAKEFTDHTYQMPKPTFVENEGVLRNTAWQNLSNHAEEDDWILAIDADEMFFYPHKSHLDKILAQNYYEVIGVTFYHMWNSDAFRIDKAWRPTLSTRLFRFKEGGEFIQRKLACGSEPTYVHQLVRQGKFLGKSHLSMKHLGYLSDEDKEAKYERYMKLDGGDFHAINHLKSIMDDDPTLIKWKGSDNG